MDLTNKEKQDLIFQFHYGSIIRIKNTTFIIIKLRFQFHYGSIISASLQFENGLRISFQFHYGSIIRSIS